jgi:hypothetical protein
MPRVMLDKLEDKQEIIIPEKYMKPHHETQQCCHCGSRAKVSVTNTGLICGACGTISVWK